jgi:hypothetical protein
VSIYYIKKFSGLARGPHSKRHHGREGWEGKGKTEGGKESG